MGVTRTCVAVWVDRFAAEGETGLYDRSSRPIACRPRHRQGSSSRSSTSGGWNVVGPTGSAQSSASRPAPRSRGLGRHALPRWAMLDRPDLRRIPRLRDRLRRRPRHHQDRTPHDRQRLGLPLAPREAGRARRSPSSGGGWGLRESYDSRWCIRSASCRRPWRRMSNARSGPTQSPLASTRQGGRIAISAA